MTNLNYLEQVKQDVLRYLNDEILDYMDMTEIDNIRKNLLNGREVKEC